ncbi:hypothetical protein C4M83_01965, partial [Mycoplasmopsis pullorum]
MLKKIYKYLGLGTISCTPFLMIGATSNEIKKEELKKISILFKVKDYNVDFINKANMDQFETKLNNELNLMNLKWNIYRSQLVNYFSLNFENVKKSDFPKFEKFLKKINNDNLLEEFSFNVYPTLNNKSEYSVPILGPFKPDDNTDMDKNAYVVNPHLTNFLSNRFTSGDRDNINLYRFDKVNRINVGVFEVSHENEYLVNFGDSDYFFTDKWNKGVNQVFHVNNGGGARISEHATLVASIIGGKGGVNLHTRIYSDGYSGEG